MTPADGVHRVRTNGWRQGKLVREDDHTCFPEQVLVELPLDGRVLIVTQDCDLVHESYTTEPKVEVILVEPIEGAPDGNLTYGKNPRRLQIPFKSIESEVWLQCNAANRHFVPRTILEEILPDDDLVTTDHGREVLVRWLANRYRRAAFPDEFNNRLAPILSRCERQLRKLASDLVGVYLRLNKWAELDAAEPYKVILFGVMERNSYHDQPNLHRAQDLIDAVAELMKDCDGIEVVQSGVVSEEDFSLYDLRQFKNWNLDAASLREGDSPPLPPH